jgi:hypothetical protein
MLNSSLTWVLPPFWLYSWGPLLVVLSVPERRGDGCSSLSMYFSPATQHSFIVPMFDHSVPIGVAALTLFILAIPHSFPLYQNTEARRYISKPVFRRVDLPGTLLVVLATLTFTAALIEADSQFPWRSAYVISLLTSSGFLWLGLLVWERHVTLIDGDREPILPWRFITHRPMLAILLYYSLIS